MFFAPAANAVVIPAAGADFSGHQRFVAQTAPPELGVEFALAEVIRVEHVEALAREVMQQFLEFRVQRLVSEFVGRQQRGGAGEFINGALPVHAFAAGERE